MHEWEKAGFPRESPGTVIRGGMVAEEAKAKLFTTPVLLNQNDHTNHPGLVKMRVLTWDVGPEMLHF